MNGSGFFRLLDAKFSLSRLGGMIGYMADKKLNITL